MIFGYKFLLQAIGVYLAFSIRKVKIKGLNDSKEVSIILYVTSGILFIIMLVTFILGDYINVDASVYGIGISSATFVVLGFIFIPKVSSLYVAIVKVLKVVILDSKTELDINFFFIQMFLLYKDPNGESIFSSKTRSASNFDGGACQMQFTSMAGNATLPNKVFDIAEGFNIPKIKVGCIIIFII